MPAGGGDDGEGVGGGVGDANDDSDLDDLCQKWERDLTSTTTSQLATNSKRFGMQCSNSGMSETARLGEFSCPENGATSERRR
jgi:hypothetical protein